jgi:hypothetical protein
MTDQPALSFAKDIRPMFTDVDVSHMKSAGIDLSDKADVQANAEAIYETVSEGIMPPPGTGETWTPEMCARFKEWQTQGCPP